MNEIDQSVVAILERTRDLLIHDGWCQGAAEIGTRRCLIRALGSAVAREHSSGTIGAGVGFASRELFRHLPPQWRNFPRASLALVKWNDEPGRHLDEVLDLLDRTIERVGVRS